MKNTILLTYASIILPIMGFIYDAPKSINLVINGILFISSISMLFIIFFYEKKQNKFTHTLPLLIIYSLYNFLVHPILGVIGLVSYYLVYKKYNEEEYDLENLESIVPITFLFSKLSKEYYIIFLVYLIALILISI